MVFIKKTKGKGKVMTHNALPPMNVNKNIVNTKKLPTKAANGTKGTPNTKAVRPNAL